MAKRAPGNPAEYCNGLHAKEAARVAAANVSGQSLTPTLRQAVAEFSYRANNEQRDPSDPAEILIARLPLRLAQAIDFYQRIVDMAAMFEERGESPIDDGVIESKIQHAFQVLEDLFAAWLRTSARDHVAFLPPIEKAGE